MKHPIGYRNGDLTVIGECESTKSHAMCMVRCVCGTEKPIRVDWLGRVKSCGCQKGRRCAEGRTTHGASKTREYGIWCGIKRRCNRTTDREFKNYGGRGIKVCERWAQSFESFIADMGPAPEGFEIERNDVNGDYEPGNCRWIPAVEQARNTRKTKLSMEKAAEIRRRRHEGFDALAAEFGVTRSSIEKVVYGEQWRLK